jgi:hypothetical protein
VLEITIAYSLVPTTDHGALGIVSRWTGALCLQNTYHAQTHALVLVHEVGEDLGCGSNRDTLLVAELVQAALHAKVGLPVGLAGAALRRHGNPPVLAVCGTTGHCAEEVGVDLDDLLDGSRR